MRAKTNRPITAKEVAVIEATLEHGSVVTEASGLGRGVEDLRVVDRCECGCDSVDFREHDPAHPAKPVADGVGMTPGGGTVGVIVWGTDEAITALEIYDLGAGDDGVRLPDPGTIRPFPRDPG